ncbi:phenylacetic acid degradation protein B [Halogeometricum borinquense DSM 11551]|uniref:Phenylacetic acid degradation B n=1 Tax=Halogeometricum borinquense (strain ATCC 700274 / DSM 11551 / JCM 10706 / KCTC 4070 / PR3) TaxID=469382 RepID=E4NV25_HALBP|nr:Htur_1727 family rSAM-partnered candidate RiPP [Halogeometricum borinquense]ADQ69014.1 Phenylacetic acid degradation B [Halogeometricum borinquense DSM 11551]ELY29483.1 phenylacetic acid degradation protein B [Halogeometricum borinquense DSM 11551]
MVEKPDRYRVGEEPRTVDERDSSDGRENLGNAVEREWEVFVREDDDDALRHVGSVSAPSADIAYEQATKLFGWYANDIWVCPADAVCRYSTHTLDDDAERMTISSKDEERTHEA